MDPIGPEDVAAALNEMLAAQIRKNSEAPDDAALMVKAYMRALQLHDRHALEKAVDEVIQSGKKFLPTPGELAVIVRRHTPKAVEAAKPCSLRGCECIGPVDAVVGRWPCGPVVRTLEEHERIVLGLPRPAETSCPYAGCGCEAVALYVPIDFEERGRRPDSLPVTLEWERARGTAPPKLVWLWYCVAAPIKGARWLSPKETS